MRSSSPAKSAPAPAGDFSRFTVREHQDSNRLAKAVWKTGYAPDHLVGVTRVGVGTEVQLHCLVELGGGQLFYQPQRLFGLVLAVRVYSFRNCCITFAVLRQCQSPVISIPILRAVPSIIAMACFHRPGIQVG